MTEQNLFEARSISGCLRASYSYCTEHAKILMRGMWLPILLLAIAATVSIYVSSPNKTLNDWGMTHPVLATVGYVLLELLGLVAGVWYMARLITFFNGATLLRNSMRTAKAMGWLVGELIVLTVFFGLAIALIGDNFVAGLAKGEGWGKVLVAWAVYLLLVVVLTIPFSYAGMKYIYHHDTKFRHFVGKDFCVGLRHFGFLFLVRFLTTLIYSLLSAILLMPFLLLYIGQIYNQLGMQEGDPNGMPGYFLPLYVVVSVLTMCVLIMLSVWNTTTDLYAFGAIETRLQEKEQLKAAQQEQVLEK